MAFLTTSILWTSLVNAQENTNSSGGDAIGSDGTVAYSIGQVVYTTNIGSNGSLAQGIQHAYEIKSIEIKETELNISLNVFPNPTMESLTIQINDFNNEKLTYQLKDLHGKILSIGQIVAQHTHINTAILTSSSYFLNVFNQENNIVQSFKIIKNQ